MDHINQKIIVYLENNHYQDWELCLKSKLKSLKSSNIEIDSRNLELSCSDIKEIIKISSQHNCKIISFCSTSPKTIVSAQSLGLKSHFIIESDTKNTSNLNEKTRTTDSTTLCSHRS